MVELLALAVRHHFDVAATVGTNEDTAAVRPESVTRWIRNEFKGLVAAGRASVTVERTACCIASGVVDHHSTSFIQNSRRQSVQDRLLQYVTFCIFFATSHGHMSTVPSVVTLAFGYSSRNTS